jgi:hypothetical protein
MWMAFPCDGHYFIFAFLLTGKINLKLYMPFFNACDGCKRSLASYTPTQKTRWVISHRRWVWPPPIQIDVGLQGRLAWRATCHSAKPTDIHCWSGSAHVKRAPCQSEPVRTWNLLRLYILATSTRRTIGTEEREEPCPKISKRVRFQRRGTRSGLLNLQPGFI